VNGLQAEHADCNQADERTWAAPRGELPAPPVVAESGPGQRRLFTSAIGLAYLLVAALVVRLVTESTLAPWWTVCAVVVGLVAADFLSGIVHWSADTWGRDDLPVIGRLLLVPFRVHHVNPDDFRTRRFVDVNGDVALVAVPILAALQTVGPDTAMSGAAVAFGLSFCTAAMLTNQIHQWAHMEAPPRAVRILQKCGLLLGPSSHAAHHLRPFDVRYCITTGWCNRPLERLRFFRTLETIVTRVTCAQPRQGDRQYEEQYGLSPQVVDERS
jgi:hypothetical protein